MNSHNPKTTLFTRVSGRAVTSKHVRRAMCDVRGAVLGATCVVRATCWGLKSVASPGTLYSYGPRVTVGVSVKLCSAGGEVVCHSRVVASHGLSLATRPRFQLQNRFTMNRTWMTPSAHADQPWTMFQCWSAWP